MDMWQQYMGFVEGQLGSRPVLLRNGQRWNSSIAQIQDRSVELEKGAVSRDYTEFGRYIIAKNLTFDLFVSLYDVNTRRCVALRLADQMPQKELDAAIAPLKRLPRRNVEMRAIGMQDGHAPQAPVLDHVRRALHCRLMEADMFGTDVRHVAVDLKTGASYNLLLLNRIYRPGELKNQQTYEQFVQQIGSKAPGKQGSV
ncbi:MAG: hypothetical protein KGH69_02185 [Candidatus Micrarchaeota archaeon]|nr:hypothetical protein [Candidatus Micrarchaeota archaeon]